MLSRYAVSVIVWLLLCSTAWITLSHRDHEASADVLNVLHTRATAITFAFCVDVIERYAQCFAAIVGIYRKFFVVFAVTVARGVVLGAVCLLARTANALFSPKR